MDMTGKSAIVTGAGKGIGLEICSKLVQAGASVVLNDVDGELALKAAATAAGSTGTCVAVAGDSSDPAVIAKMVEGAVGLTGTLDIAIANAGITLFGDFLSYPAEDLYRVFQVNLGGTFLLAQAAANQMKAQGKGGSLLFMSSVTGHQAHRQLAAYGMSKAAIEMLAKNLVIELSQYGINVNTVAPGATLTERTLEDANYTAIWSKITPMGRPARVEDIANAALFLVSDGARHITGQSLVIDGGWTSTSPNPY
jgi:glucose 1-dehydrogenase